MEKRRDTRVSGHLAVFRMVAGNSEILCQVSNLSRLGIGIEFPAGQHQDVLAATQIGTPVKGTLSVDADNLVIESVVRVKSQLFLGLEFASISMEFMNKVRDLLSPMYIGATLHAIHRDYLSDDIEAAYRGDDFECVIFKKGTTPSKSKKSLQIFAEGQVVEVVGTESRFVPAPLMRSTGKRGGFDFITEFASYHEGHGKEELREFFMKVARVFKSWEDCPADLHVLVEEQLKLLV